MPNSLIVPLLVLLLLAVVIALGLPLVRRSLRGAWGTMVGRVLVLHYSRGTDGARQQHLAKTILRGVIRGTDRTLHSRSLPEVVVVEACRVDFGLLQRIHKELADELNEEWAAYADAEGWRTSGWVRIELVEDETQQLGRPSLQLLQTSRTGAETFRDWPGNSAVEDDTPFQSGAYVLTDQQLHVPLVAGRAVVAGRRPDLCDIAVDDQHASKRHVMFMLESDGGVRVQDLGSRNRTFVDGVEIIELVVHSDSEVRLGRNCRLYLRWT